MPTELLELTRNEIERLQYRGSDDGITWTEWRQLPSFGALVPPFGFYQARIEIDGGWRVSPIATQDWEA